MTWRVGIENWHSLAPFYDVFACELYKQIKEFSFRGNFSTQQEPQDDRVGGRERKNRYFFPVFWREVWTTVNPSLKGWDIFRSPFEDDFIHRLLLRWVGRGWWVRGLFERKFNKDEGRKKHYGAKKILKISFRCANERNSISHWLPFALKCECLMNLFNVLFFCALFSLSV